MIARRPGSRALLVGAGSGRDIATALLVRDELGQPWGPVDLGGFLTPWALHRFGDCLERPVNRVQGRARKFCPAEETQDLPSFFEPLLPEFCARYGAAIDNVYLFSLQHGTSALRDGLDDLVARADYGTVVVVDAGGDILATAAERGTLLTPLVDRTALHLAAELPEHVRVILAVIVPGACGEIGPVEMRRLLLTLDRDGAILGECRYGATTEAFRRYERISGDIDARTGSRSCTGEVIRTLAHRGETGTFHGTHQRVFPLAGEPLPVRFAFEVAPDCANRIIFFDLRQVAKARLDPDWEFDSVLEAFLRTRASGVAGLEVDLSFVPLEMHAHDCSEVVFLLTPWKYLCGGERAAALNRGLAAVAAGRLRRAIVLSQDVPLLTPHPEVQLFPMGDYRLLSRSESDRALAERLARWWLRPGPQGSGRAAPASRQWEEVRP